MENNLMKWIMYQIIETVLFVGALFLIAQISIYFDINFNFPYVFSGLLIAWAAVKVIVRRRMGHNKDKNEKPN